MEESEPQRRPLRFGNFEIDLESGELRKGGMKLRLGGQPFQVLAILLERPGKVVTREELQKRLWPDTFVDVDHNLNTCINKIREVLGDSAESPRFVETMPRRGYRFIAQVDGGQLALPLVPPDPIPPTPRVDNRWLYYLLGALIASLGGWAAWKAITHRPEPPRVTRYTKLTNDGLKKSGHVVTDGTRVFFTEWLPDGRSIIAQVSSKGGEVTPFPVSLKMPILMDLSKDSTQLLLLERKDSDNTLWLQPVAGGSPRRVGTVKTFMAAFGPDETTILYEQEHDFEHEHEHEVYSIHLDGSAQRKVLTLPGYSRSLEHSPDSSILRVCAFDGDSETWTVLQAEADGRGLHTAFEGCNGKWFPDGHYFVYSRQIGGHFSLWTRQEAKGFGWSSHEGASSQLTPSTLDFDYPFPSKDGHQILAIGMSQRSEVVRYDAQTHDFVSFLPGVSGEFVAFSPNGQRVAYNTLPERDLWTSKLDGSDPLQLTFPPMAAGAPRWSPDGKEIVFGGILPNSKLMLYMIPSTGGSAEQLLPGPDRQQDATWSPDGRSLVFSSFPNPSKGIYVLDVQSRAVSTLPDSIGYSSPRWSPNGRYILALKENAGLMVFDVNTRKWREVCSHGVLFQEWSHNSDYIYFLTPPRVHLMDFADNSLHIIRVRVSDHKIEDVASTAKLGRLSTGSYGSWLGLAPDDSPLLARDIGTQEIYALDVDSH